VAHLLEVARGHERVDRDQGVIYGAKIVGLTSKNTGKVIGLDPREFNGAVDQTYTYSRQALESARPMYEGAQIRIKHQPTKIDKTGRRVMLDHESQALRVAGELRNVVMREDGLYGDIHLLKSREGVDIILEVAERFPRQIALSHNAHGKPVLRSGRAVIEEITKVVSVDIVDDEPGTTNGLFETHEEPDTVSITLKEIIESAAAKHKTQGVAATLLEMLDEMPPKKMEDEEVEMAEMDIDVPAEASTDDQVEAAFKTMAMAAVDDPNLDASATGKKVTEILKAKDKLMGKETTEESPDDKGKKAEAIESAVKTRSDNKAIKELQETVAALEARNQDLEDTAHARQLIESLDREPTDLRVNAVKRCESDSERRQLIEDWSKRESELVRVVPRPHRSAPLMESAAPDSKLLQGDAFIAAIKG